MRQYFSPKKYFCGKEFIKIKGTPSGLTQFLAAESASEIMKNDFYFILKAIFVFIILDFCLDFLVM